MSSSDVFSEAVSPVKKQRSDFLSDSASGFARTFFSSRAFGWTIVLVLLAVWQIVASIYPMPQLPALSDIYRTWVEQVVNGDLIVALADTMRITAIGFVVATVVGIILGFLMGRVTVIWGAAEPSVELVRQIPISALLPLLILYLGIADSFKITIVVLAASFPILLNTFAGARSVSKTMRQTAQTFQLSWLQAQLEIGLPAALPYILVGMRQALGVTLVIAVVTGMLAGNSGIGYYILQAQQVLDIRALFAGILTVAAVGYVLNAIFLVIEHRLTRWRTFSSGQH
ncbi:ABC transporter permease [Neorhizobium lilium]|uniref:ABC transporter permease n=1 Tax=Neorhizobium lilium TaxID=2503024 RepID=A0A3S3VTP7_9HYPH|nr:ABC transporter permease [Neorhizobium lilium]RWX81640.1 ABC transporter permease [Neorhizobium lilium]